MSYLGDVWSNLQFNAGNATSQFVSSLNWRYKKGSTGDLKYISRSAYKSVLVHVAKQLAMSNLEGELNSLLPKLQKRIQNERLKSIREQQDTNGVALLEGGRKSTEGFGRIELKVVGNSGLQVDETVADEPIQNSSVHTLIAKTKYGTPVPEALILSFDMSEDEEPIEFTDVYWEHGDSYSIKKKNTLEKIWNPSNQIEYNAASYIQTTFQTRTVFHIDLAPSVSMSSEKNVILTKVQGRDYSRKELVSGGDLVYSVQGDIVSDNPYAYPTEAVKRFMRIMQYQGIVNVNYITFGLLGVKKIIIQNFELKPPTCKNIQPYSFKCVAVEPDDIITLSKDTISAVNTILYDSKMDSWYASILDSKLGQIAAKTAVRTASNVVTSAAGVGLDELLPNI